MRVLHNSFRERENQSSQTLISTFLPCPSCGTEKMNSGAWGAHSAFKVRDQMNSQTSNEKQSSSQSFKMTPTQNDCPDNPTKYNSKAMNAVWGIYNRYASFNMKARSYDKA